MNIGVLLTVYLSIILVINQLNAQHLVWLYACTCFEHYVLIVRRSKLYYTASGIITLKQFYYHVLIFIELYFSNFRPLICFSVMIPDAV